MKKFDRITPNGTGDLVFLECNARYTLIEKLRHLFSNFGYGEVRTPTIEFFDTFSNGIGRLSQNSLYTLTDSAGRLLVMRPDTTKPIARLYASRLYNNILPLRIYYTQPVFRRNIELCKKSDEFEQSGIELIGSNSFKADVEALTLAINSMYSIFANDFYLEIGHMGLLKPILLSINDDELRREVKIAIVNKNYPDLIRLSELLGDKGRILREIPALFGSSNVLEYAEKIFTSKSDCKILTNLKSLCKIASHHISQDNIIVDLAIMHEYDYYTGLVFSGYVKGEGSEILSGGRYDSLYSDYKLNIPAIGFAINIDRATKAYLKSNQYKPSVNLTAVLYSDPESDNTIITNTLIHEGYIVVNSLLDSKADAIKYARSLDADLFVFSENNKFVRQKLK
ncbi:MAG: ATP phosphoribosyltransferase regulatory subunit [Christensenellaceae bacterium]|jgi:ATP phosphoribosyltransferase regulatory subunit|nr:ATP phosphoribosyltransferase regulatory subunit [Christensenellaceae bacterium]